MGREGGEGGGGCFGLLSRRTEEMKGFKRQQRRRAGGKRKGKSYVGEIRVGGG